MSNLAAAFEGASQGLGQMAGMAMQHEMAMAMAVRAENLAILRNQLSTRRELLVTGARGQVLNTVSNNRVAAEHAARDEEINRQEGRRARNQATAQHQQLIDTEHAQDNAFTNQAELQARAQSRTDRVQTARDALLEANQARQQQARIRDWLTKYVASNHVDSSGGTDGTLTGDPLDSQQLAQRAQHDAVLASQLRAYKDASDREAAATRTMQFPDSSAPSSAPGAAAPSSDALASPPTSSLIPIPSEGPGIADQPYPNPSAADEIGLSGGASGGNSGTAGDDDGSSTDY